MKGLFIIWVYLICRLISMIVSLSDNEKNINAALNSLDVTKDIGYINNRLQDAQLMIQRMTSNVAQCREAIENEISELLRLISIAETHLHDINITSYDSLIAECREVLNSFDPDGQITDTDATLF